MLAEIILVAVLQAAIIGVWWYYRKTLLQCNAPAWLHRYNHDALICWSLALIVLAMHRRLLTPHIITTEFLNQLTDWVGPDRVIVLALVILMWPVSLLIALGVYCYTRVLIFLVPHDPTCMKLKQLVVRIKG